MDTEAIAALDILVVEDNRLNLALTRAVLELSGHRVVSAESGSEFRAYLAKGARPSIVLLDIMLGDSNGIDLLTELRQASHLDGVPVVAVTAQALVGEAQRLRDAGFNAVLTKPIDTKKFAQQIALIASSQVAPSEAQSLSR